MNEQKCLIEPKKWNFIWNSHYFQALFFSGFVEKWNMKLRSGLIEWIVDDKERESLEFGIAKQETNNDCDIY